MQVERMWKTECVYNNYMYFLFYTTKLNIRTWIIHKYGLGNCIMYVHTSIVYYNYTHY